MLLYVRFQFFLVLNYFHMLYGIVAAITNAGKLRIIIQPSTPHVKYDFSKF